MKLHKLKYYQDPGHGWIAVKRDLIEKLGIHEQISGYSYQKGGMVYLEEDCDSAVLLNAIEANGDKWELINVLQDKTPIRGYMGYTRFELPSTYSKFMYMISKYLDKFEDCSYRANMLKALQLFRYESQYNKKPDTKNLRLWAKYVNRVLVMKKIII